MKTLTAPKTLNGFPVIASAPRKAMPDRLAVLMYRQGDGHPYVIAQWNENCGDTWVYGHYYRDLIEAVGHFAAMTGQSDVMKRAAGVSRGPAIQRGQQVHVRPAAAQRVYRGLYAGLG